MDPGLREGTWEHAKSREALGTKLQWLGNPLQYSCLENPRDGGTWWAAIYGVAQSRTQLKRLQFHFSLSSSSRGSLLLLLLLSHFSRVQLCATPWMAAHQVPPSLGFSRQEHWSGLPFPSPMTVPDSLYKDPKTQNSQSQRKEEVLV